MNKLLGLILLFLLCTCQSKDINIHVNILDGDKLISFETSLTTPESIFNQAGIFILPADKIQFQGVNLPTDFSLPSGGYYTLKIRRSHKITLITPDNQIEFDSSEPNVGQALVQTGIQFFSADYISPNLDTPINNDLTVNYRPSKYIVFSLYGKTIPFRSSQKTVGQALSSAGFPLSGLDKSSPADSDDIPPDGQINIIHIKETVSLSENILPASTQYEYSTNQPAGQQEVLQVGENGLKVLRIRTRFENDKEVSKITESSVVVRQPKNSIIRISSQNEVKTIDTPDGQFQYWRAVQMYTTSYSPCRSGTSKCSFGTASGLQVKHGVVALIPSFFNLLAGSQVYIPGYGIGVIGDVGGGFPDGRLWIDLGYSDDDYQSWSGMHTVYFLAPAPTSIPPGLN